MASRVECYSGYTYGERPVALHWGTERLEVLEILARWQSPQGKHFRVRTEDRRIFELLYHESADEWHITLLHDR